MIFKKYKKAKRTIQLIEILQIEPAFMIFNLLSNDWSVRPITYIYIHTYTHVYMECAIILTCCHHRHYDLHSS